MRQVSDNAYQQYLRSRPPPSSESAKRIKELNISNAGILPEFKSLDNGVTDILTRMKNYRPPGVRIS